MTKINIAIYYKKISMTASHNGRAALLEELRRTPLTTEPGGGAGWNQTPSISITLTIIHMILDNTKQYIKYTYLEQTLLRSTCLGGCIRSAFCSAQKFFHHSWFCLYCTWTFVEDFHSSDYLNIKKTFYKSGGNYIQDFPAFSYRTELINEAQQLQIGSRCVCGSETALNISEISSRYYLCPSR